VEATPGHSLRCARPRVLERGGVGYVGGGEKFWGLKLECKRREAVTGYVAFRRKRCRSAALQGTLTWGALSGARDPLQGTPAWRAPYL
jgi:hypothetical protein